MIAKLSGMLAVVLSVGLLSACSQNASPASTSVANSEEAQKALAERKQHEQTAVNQALSNAAQAAEQAYDYSNAAANYQQLVEREPDNMQYLLGLAKNQRYAGAVRESIKTTKKGIERFGERPALIIELAKGQIAGQMLSAASETVATGKQTAPQNWEVYATSGILHDRQSRFDEAQADYRRALELSPGNVAVLNNLALSLAQSGQLDEAIATLRKVTDTENSTPQTRQNLALLYALQGEYEKAEKLIREDLPPAQAKENIEKLRRIGQRKEAGESLRRIRQ